MDQRGNTRHQNAKDIKSNDRKKDRKGLLDLVRARTLQRKRNILLRQQQDVSNVRTPFAPPVAHGKGRVRRDSYAKTTPKAKSWSGWSASSLVSDSTGGEGTKLYLDWSQSPTRPHVQAQFTFKPPTLSTMPLNLSEEARQTLRWIQNQWLELIDRARLLTFTHAQYNLLSSYMKRAERAFIDAAIIIQPPRTSFRGVVVDLDDLMAAAERTVDDIENRVFTEAWDQYTTAQRRLGLQYALVAEIERSEADKNRDSGRRPFDHPPRDRKTFVEKEWVDRADGWFHNAQYLGFDNAILVRGLDWVLKGTLAIGGRAHIGLWVGCDHDGKIVDTLVIKETYCSMQAWKEDDMWMFSTKYGSSMPREACMHHILSSQAGSEDIVRYRGFQVYDRLFMYRIYMDYCDIKDNLADVLDNHIGDTVPPCTEGDAFQNFVEPEIPVSLMRPKLPPCRIPEPALWAVFEALARAAHHMKCGSPRHSDASTPAPAHWTTVVHNDIKPANIFLSTASPEDPRWPGLPKFKLGDFGLARLYRPNAHLQPGPHRGAGTPAFMAPVCPAMAAPDQQLSSANAATTQEQLARPPPALHKPLVSSTNIYAVGLTLAHLIGCAPAPAGDPIPPLLSPARVAFYSSRLLLLVKRCLHTVPEERVTVEELGNEIESAVGGPQGRRALGMSPWLEEGLEGLRVVGDEAYDRRWKARM